MSFKISLLVFPALLLTNSLFAKSLADSIGVENQNGKKVILHKVEPKEPYFGVGRRYNVKPNVIIQYNNNVVLHPGMNIQEAIAVFDAAEAESLAVVDTDGEHRPIGVLSEAHAMRRYAEESEQRRREVLGEV